MSGVIAIPLATPATTPKKRSKPKKTGPTVSDRILKVVSASSDRSGVSLAALKKSLAASGYDVVKNNARLKLAVRRLVAKGYLLQPKGTGASGSFKINKNKAVAKKKRPTKNKVKKVGAKKVRRASPKKAAGAKKSPKKTKRKSPKKAKRPAAAKKPKSPRKTKRRVAKSTRAKTAPKKK
ncbi:histone H1 [Salmo salar]|uniref:Histone H1 n=1 Tax=Salmo salar TaxID=8030 RepID=B9ENC7_SALSA|nr:histone H1 [Salmo salar]ACM09024.1 Histone H1 [Salmo salar]ACM09091.1 Histone H1 [Salmo salar]|eukprot:XP_014027979.1 PREDICTED: histone H1-like [Salmo salar]